MLTFVRVSDTYTSYFSNFHLYLSASLNLDLTVIEGILCELVRGRQ